MADKLYLKEERFCQLVVEGWVWEDACAEVKMDVEASRVGPRAGLYRDRIAELGGAPGGIGDEMKPMIDPRDISENWIMERLLLEYQKAAGPSGSPKVAAEVLERMGKLKGYFVQKREVSFPKIGDMSPAQLREQLKDTTEAEWEEIRTVTGFDYRPKLIGGTDVDGK